MSIEAPKPTGDLSAPSQKEGIFQRFFRFVFLSPPQQEAEWSLEKYKASIEAQIAANNALREQGATKWEAMRQSQIAEQKAAAELTQNRRKQAEAFREESGVGTLVSELEKLIKLEYEERIKMDSTRQCAIGSVRFPVCGDTDDYGIVHYSTRVQQIGHKVLPKHPHDTDSTLDAMIWGDGDKRVVKRTENSATERSYLNYFIVEVTPKGDIVFHSKLRNPISAILWRTDKKCLEEALGKAFNTPAIYHDDNTYGTWVRRPDDEIHSNG